MKGANYACPDVERLFDDEHRKLYLEIFEIMRARTKYRKSKFKALRTRWMCGGGRRTYRSTNKIDPNKIVYWGPASDLQWRKDEVHIKMYKNHFKANHLYVADWGEGLHLMGGYRQWKSAIDEGKDVSYVKVLYDNEGEAYIEACIRMVVFGNYSPWQCGYILYSAVTKGYVDCFESFRKYLSGSMSSYKRDYWIREYAKEEYSVDNPDKDQFRFAIDKYGQFFLRHGNATPFNNAMKVTRGELPAYEELKEIQKYMTERANKKNVFKNRMEQEKKTIDQMCIGWGRMQRVVGIEEASKLLVRYVDDYLGELEQLRMKYPKYVERVIDEFNRSHRIQEARDYVQATVC